MFRGPLVAQTIKNLPAMWETQAQSLGQEDPLEKEMDNPLWYSCLENYVDRGAWWATVHGDRKESDRTERLACLYSVFYGRVTV